MPTGSNSDVVLSMRNAFDLDPNLVYLNSANQSILPRRVREAIAGYQIEYERNPTAGLNSAWGQLWEVQGRLARFLCADRRDLFLRTNVTSVLNTFLLGIPLPPGSEILAGELEYGAIVNVCRMRAQRENLKLRVLKMPGTVASMKQVTRERLVEDIVSQLGPQTRMVLLSHVLGGTGLILPIKELAAEMRRREIYLVVDGAYAPGALAVKLEELSEVDFYGCSLYKWMLGPKGTAFGWVAPRHQALLRPLGAGWTTFDTFGPFTEFGGGSRFQESFLMAGCHDFAPFRAIADTLDLWDHFGAERIRERMRSLQLHLVDEVARVLGWLPWSADAPELNGPMLAFRLPEALQKDGAAILSRVYRELGIQVNTFWLRGQWNMTFSPHIHNSEEEISAAVERLGHL